MNTSALTKSISEAIKFYNRKNFDDAKEIFYEILEDDPSNPEANYYLGLIFSKEEDYSKAVIHLKNVVDMGTYFLYTQQCRMILGFIYSKNREYERALYEFEQVLKSNTKTVQVYAALSTIHYYLGNRDEALRYAEKAFSIDPYNVNIKNTYGYLLCDYEVDIKKGLELLKDVVRIKPNNPAYLDSIGWGYFRAGDRTLALEFLRRAKQESNVEEIETHYKVVFENSGK